MLLRARSRGARCTGGSCNFASPAPRFRLPLPTAPSGPVTSSDSPLRFSVSILYSGGTGGRRVSGTRGKRVSASGLGVGKRRWTVSSDGWDGVLEVLRWAGSTDGWEGALEVSN